MLSCLRVVPIALAIGAGLRCAGAEVQQSNAPPTFEADIRPILRAHCFDCHGATEEKQGGLDLRLVRFQLVGGDSGPALTPGDPDASHLLVRIRAGEMPPGEGKVAPKEIEAIERLDRRRRTDRTA